MRGSAVAALSFVALITISARAQSWRIGDDQPFRIRLTDLSNGRQKAILKSIGPSIQGRAAEFELDPDELAAAEKSLLVKEIRTEYGTLTLVQGADLNLCGGTGNCKVWILGSKDRLLLDGQAYRLTVLRTARNGLPSIVTSSSWTDNGSDFIRYSFDGSRYKPQACAFERMMNFRGKVYPRPHLDYVACSLVEPIRPIQSEHP